MIQFGILGPLEVLRDGLPVSVGGVKPRMLLATLALHHGRAVRIHYHTQATTRPPTFVLWANTPDGLAPSYKRFLANRLRARYGFRGTPIRIALKARPDRHKQEN